MRLIDADALKQKAFGRRGGLVHTSDIDDAPTIEERKRGKWIQQNDTLCVCTICKHHTRMELFFKEMVFYPFCPNCGADMRGEEHG